MTLWILLSGRKNLTDVSRLVQNPNHIDTVAEWKVEDQILLKPLDWNSSEAGKALQQVQPRSWPFRESRHRYFFAIDLRDSIFAIASCLRSLQNFSSTGIESPELSPSSKSESS